MANVLFIRWDAADCKAIHPLIDAGKMPSLRMRVETGTMRRVANLQPPSSQMPPASTHPRSLQARASRFLNQQSDVRWR